MKHISVISLFWDNLKDSGIFVDEQVIHFLNICPVSNIIIILPVTPTMLILQSDDKDWGESEFPRGNVHIPLWPYSQHGTYPDSVHFHKTRYWS